MYYKEIKELTELCLQAAQETDACILFHFNTTGYRVMQICIKDNGCVPVRYDYDGDYTFYRLPELKEITEDNIQAARRHLAKLLKEAEEANDGDSTEDSPGERS